jgi:hypothetical protein
MRLSGRCLSRVGWVKPTGYATNQMRWVSPTLRVLGGERVPEPRPTLQGLHAWKAAWIGDL